jgi:alanyl-tRNA synthetase
LSKHVTERLYYTDCYVTRFSTRAVSVTDDGRRVRLEESAFYPTSGGQLYDTGEINGVRVLDVIDEGDDVVHVLAGPIEAGPVQCAVDWARRYEFMQQHTGQHLLSAVFHALHGFETVSVHLGEDGATIELGTPTVTAEQIRAAESRVNELIVENHAVSISFEESPDGLRKASERTGTLRVVTIEGLDKSACGGTHVRRTGEIGAVLIRKQEKIRGNMRLEFVCGAKAVRRARADYDTLTAAARAFSRPLEEVPEAIAALQESARETAKQVKALQLEIAALRGPALFATAPGGAIRRHRVDLSAIDETTRALAQAFTACGPAVFLAVAGNTVLIASSDPGIACGERLKQHGRGGGTATLAQGSVADVAPLAASLGF